MNPSELEALEKLRESIKKLTQGEDATAVETSEECGNVVSRLVETFNEYFVLLDETKTFVISLASGNLDATSPPKNQIAAPFKQLHASLQHLTWQTKQIAQGDFSQRVRFLGEFSDSFNSMVETLAEKERIEAALREARSQVRHLEGIIPICMYCKKIRDDEASWQQLESYISNHSEAMFSHGICPHCLEEHYPPTKKTV